MRPESVPAVGTEEEVIVEDQLMAVATLHSDGGGTWPAAL